LHQRGEEVVEEGERGRRDIEEERKEEIAKEKRGKEVQILIFYRPSF